LFSPWKLPSEASPERLRKSFRSSDCPASSKALPVSPLKRREELDDCPAYLLLTLRRVRQER